MIPLFLYAFAAVPAGVEFVNMRRDGRPVDLFWVAPLLERNGFEPSLSPQRDVEHVSCNFGGAPVGSTSTAEALEKWGTVTITVRKDWAPLGAARFLELVRSGFYDAVPLFRSVEGFLVQFGAKPGGAVLPEIVDDPLRPELLPLPTGTLSFAGNGVNSRGQQMWLSLAPNLRGLGEMAWETPVGYLESPEDIETLLSIYMGYGDMPQQGGRGPDPQKIAQPDGVEYIRRDFPHLTWLVGCELLPKSQTAPSQAREEVPVGSVKPGATVRHKTWVGHTFAARVDDRLLGRYTVMHTEQTVAISDGDSPLRARPGKAAASLPPGLVNRDESAADL